MNQNQPKQAFPQQRGLKAVNFKLNVFLLDILRYDIMLTLINTVKLISAFRLVQRYCMTFLSMSNHVKGLESVNHPLTVHDVVLN